MLTDMTTLPMLPEIILLIAASVILLIDMYLADAKRSVTFALSLAALIPRVL